MNHADELSQEIRRIQWKLDVWLPRELAATTHARRLASLRSQKVEATARLARLVTDLGAATQNANH